uniref:Putative secreted protein n=1 Tax=Rhipicephalus microplus TaxID=6941 RepID=A0A6G5A4Q3_RHIMP
MKHQVSVFVMTGFFILVAGSQHFFNERNTTTINMQYSFIILRAIAKITEVVFMDEEPCSLKRSLLQAVLQKLKAQKRCPYILPLRDYKNTLLCS